MNPHYPLRVRITLSIIALLIIPSTACTLPPGQPITSQDRTPSTTNNSQNPSSEQRQGARIAFESDLAHATPGHKEGQFYICMIDTDGSHKTCFGDDLALVTSLAWSSEVKRFAFTSNRDGFDHIFLMDIEGSNITQLTDGTSLEKSPAWSPDGTRIAYSYEPYDYGKGVWMNPDIYVMNADGSNRTQLTNSPDAERDPAWSPDGKRIVFSLGHEGIARIYMMNSDGSNRAGLSEGPLDNHPAWSPDGARIVFVSSAKIAVMDADGSNPILLTDGSGIDYYPAWSPDGLHIAFSSLRDRATDIYVMDVDGSNLNRLTRPEKNYDFHDSTPIWVP